ncbi:MAG: hypothetical protein DMG79_15670, partial [Acidobacteria bacterium]
MIPKAVYFLVPLLAISLLTIPATAQTDETLYSFTGYADGGDPLSSLVADSSGNLFGTAFVGGPNGAGEVFELTRTPSGSWNQSVVYGFTGGADGANPYYADVILDAAGNLYGTTVGGGDHNLGVVFKLTRSETGWTESVLYSFAGGSDGANPYAGLVFDKAGNLFGTTYGGGSGGIGTIFELSPGTPGQWTETVLHTFTGLDGDSPAGGLTLGRNGNLYAVTQGGGAHHSGAVYQLTHSTRGWNETVLYSFTGGADGSSPYAERLLIDNSGHIYGTTEGGGAHQLGAVFRLSLLPSHHWKEQVLYSFDGSVAANPASGLIADGAGNLYGTCVNGNGETVGAVYKLLRQPGDQWTEINLHVFNREDGEFPYASPISDAAGNLYGTTLLGGTGSM